MADIREDMPKTFEEAVAELESITQKLQDSEVMLEESVHLYTRGVALKKFAENKLQDAKLRLYSSYDDPKVITALTSVEKEIAQLRSQLERSLSTVPIQYVYAKECVEKFTRNVLSELDNIQPNKTDDNK